MELSPIFHAGIGKIRMQLNWLKYLHVTIQLRWYCHRSIEVYWLIIGRVVESWVGYWEPTDVKRNSYFNFEVKVEINKKYFSFPKSLISLTATAAVAVYEVLSKFYQMSYIGNCLWPIYKRLAMIDGTTTKERNALHEY